MPSGPYDSILGEASQRFGVPEAWIRAVMDTESRGQTTDRQGNPIRSPVGAMGLMQVMPQTYDYLRRRHGLGENADDPRNNIFAGAAYMREMLDRGGGDPAYMLAGYNAGPGRADAWRNQGRPLPAETRAYIDRTLPSLTGNPSPALPVADRQLTPVAARPTMPVPTPGPGALTPMAAGGALDPQTLLRLQQQALLGQGAQPVGMPSPLGSTTITPDTAGAGPVATAAWQQSQNPGFGTPARFLDFLRTPTGLGLANGLMAASEPENRFKNPMRLAMTGMLEGQQLEQQQALRQAQTQHQGIQALMELQRAQRPESTVGRLIYERDRLPAGSPSRAAYDAAIRRETQSGPPGDSDRAWAMRYVLEQGNDPNSAEYGMAYHILTQPQLRQVADGNGNMVWAQVTPELPQNIRRPGGAGPGGSAGPGSGPGGSAGPGSGMGGARVQPITPPAGRTPEAAARLGLTRETAGLVDTVVRSPMFNPDGSVNRMFVGEVYLNLPMSEGSRVRNALELAIQNTSNILSGQSMTEAEVKRRTDALLPKPWDDEDTIRQKLNYIQGMMGQIQSLMAPGQTPIGERAPTGPAAAPQAPAQPAAAAPQASARPAGPRVENGPIPGTDPNAIPPAAQRVIGQTYSTPRGQMIWRGNGWEPVE